MQKYLVVSFYFFAQISMPLIFFFVLVVNKHYYVYYLCIQILLQPLIPLTYLFAIKSTLQPFAGSGLLINEFISLSVKARQTDRVTFAFVISVSFEGSNKISFVIAAIERSQKYQSKIPRNTKTRFCILKGLRMFLANVKLLRYLKIHRQTSTLYETTCTKHSQHQR